jgi:hypothetical protein
MLDSPEVVRLLTEIKRALEGGAGSKYWIAAIAAGSGILGAAIPAIFQFLNNRNTSRLEKDKFLTGIKAELIVKQRQEWINSIRNTANELIAEFNLVYNYADGTIKKPDQADFTKLYFEIRKKSYLLELYLNPNKPKQKRVVEALENINIALHIYCKDCSKENDTKYNDAHKELMNALIEVIGEAWQKIKKIE